MSCTVCVCVCVGGYHYNIAHFHCDVGSMSAPYRYSKLHFHQTVCNSESLIDLNEVTSTEVKVKKTGIEQACGANHVITKQLN